MGVRFQAGPFQYNSRVALALLPALLFLTSLGGRTAFGLLVVGSMITYMLDALQLKEASLMSACGTLFGTNIAIMVAGDVFEDDRPVAFSFFIMLMTLSTLFITAVWATLQFRWIQIHHPMVVLALERLLLGSLLPTTAMTYAWLAVASFGSNRGPFYLAAALAAQYYMFARPNRSSFYAQIGPVVRGGGGRAQVDAAALVLDRGEAALLFFVTAAVPGGLYVTAHMRQLGQWVHVWGSLLLLSGSVLFCCLLPQGMWWLAPTPEAASLMRRLLTYPALAVFIAAFEGRVVFRAFVSYIKIPAPWSYIHVTLVLYFVAFLAAAHFEGLMTQTLSANLAGLALVLAAGAAAMAAGFPAYVIPAPIACAVGLSLFYDSGLFRDYLIFATGAVVSVAYFLAQNFMFLDVSLGGIPLKLFCYLVIGLTALSSLLPGLLASPAPKWAVGGVLLGVGGGIAVLEEAMYFGDGDASLGEMYPLYLVCATSAALYGLGASLVRAGRAPRWCGWILQCLAAAKLSVVFIGEDPVVLQVLFLLLAITPPLFLYSPRPGHGPALPGRPSSSYRMPPYVALMHVLTVVLAAANARFFIFDMVMLFGTPHPQEGVLLGSLLLTIALGCMPLVGRFYPHSQAARRAAALGLSAAALLILLTPPMPIRGGAKCPKLPLNLCPRLWDERHVPQHILDDPLVYADRTRAHWPIWLLFIAVMFGLITATAPQTVAQAAAAAAGGGANGAADLDRGVGSPAEGAGGSGAAAVLSGPGLAALVAGGLLGSYFALEFFPGRKPLQLSVAVAAVLTSLALVFIRAMDTSGGAAGGAGGLSRRVAGGAGGMAPHPHFLGPVLALLASLLPISYVLTFVVPLPELPRAIMVLLPDAATLQSYNAERESAARAILLAMFAAEAVLIALVIKLKQHPPTAGLGSRRGSEQQLPAAALSSGGLGTPTGDATTPRLVGRGAMHRGLPTSGFLGSASAASRAAGFLGGVPVSMGGGAGIGGGAGGLASGGSMGIGMSLADPTTSLLALGWLVPVGNVAAVLCYLLAYAVSVEVLGPSDYTFMLLAPVAILVSQERPNGSVLARAFPWLSRIEASPRRRYFLPIISVSLGLFGSAISAVSVAAFTGDDDAAGGAALATAWGLLLYVGRNLASAMMIAPLHYEFARYVWQPAADAAALGMAAARPHASYLELAGLAPLALVGVPLATEGSLRTAGLMALVMAAGEAVSIYRTRSKGKRIL